MDPLVLFDIATTDDPTLQQDLVDRMNARCLLIGAPQAITGSYGSYALEATWNALPLWAMTQTALRIQHHADGLNP